MSLFMHVIWLLLTFDLSPLPCVAAVGSANAIVGGWGNLGGGITQMFMGGAIFPLFQVQRSAVQ